MVIKMQTILWIFVDILHIPCYPTPGILVSASARGQTDSFSNSCTSILGNCSKLSFCTEKRKFDNCQKRKAQEIFDNLNLDELFEPVSKCVFDTEQGRVARY